MRLSKIKSFIGLSWKIAKAEFKLRNEGSYLGIFWYLLNPLLLFILLFLIFSNRFGTSIENYSVYLLVGIVLFNFFSKSTVSATRAIIRNDLILKSINFSRESLVAAVLIENLLSHIFEILLIVGVLIIFKISLLNLIFYPIILIFFCTFIFGSCLILSSLTVYFVDLENIWVFASRLIWLGTPIFYPIGGQTKLFYVNLFNPMYYFITITRELLVYSKIQELWLIIGAVFYSVLFFVVGLFIFKKLKTKFAELL